MSEKSNPSITYNGVTVTFKSLAFEFIMNYCAEQNQLDWLETTLNSEFVNKNGKTTKTTFVQLKRAFMDKFFAGTLPPKKEKKPTMQEQIEALKKKQELVEAESETQE